MRTRTLSILPFLVAMLIGIASQGLNVYDIHTRELGTLDVGPWAGNRTALSEPTRDGVASLMLQKLRAFHAALGSLDERGEIAAELLVPVSGIKAVTQRGADLLAAMKDVRNKLADPKLSADSRAALKADFTQLEGLAEANDDDLKAERRLQDRERNWRPETPAQAQDPDAKAAAAAAAAAGITVRDRSEDDPKRGFKDHRDYLKAVMAAGRNPNRIDARLKPLAAAGSDEQGEYSDPHGGFLVPHGVAPGILSLEPEGDPLGGLVTPVTMQAPTVSFNARVDKNHSTSVSGGLRVTRRPETEDGTSSRMKFDQVTLTANEEFGIAYATERIIQDSPQSMIDIISAGFRDEYVANAMNERINGTGTGERQGALSTGCKIAVTKETGQKAATILKENIDKMAARCWRYSQAVWLANHNTRPQLKSLVQVVGTGGNAVPYLTGAPGGQEYLDNRPIFFSEFAKTLGTEGDLILLVPSQYLEGMYQSEQFAESIHVRFAAAERCFRFYRRNDGQWWWASALTPKNGDTLSPVVTLATRS
jgi:HK97 family phage major capsid protein